MDKTRLAYLFQCYVEQTCTSEEKSEFMQLIRSSAYDDQVKKLIDACWESYSSDLALPADRAGKILDEILSSHHHAPLQKDPPGVSWLYKIAASLVFILMAGGIAYFLPSSQQDDIEGAAESSWASRKEHRFIKLPDGSTVLLNAGSSLDYPPSFANSTAREVTLVGEGYFDIKHDPAKEFIVHTGELKTTVLGTAFNIRAYDTDNSITVTVTRGKVKVSDDTRVFGVISHDQQLTFDKDLHRIEHRNVKSQGSIAWTEQDIFFDDITLGEAVRQLEAKFSTSITFSNPEAKACRFTATFVSGENLKQILKVICEFNGVNYKDDGNANFIITGNGCSNEF